MFDPESRTSRKNNNLAEYNGVGALESLSRPALALSLLPQVVFAIATMKSGAPSSIICEDRARIYDSGDLTMKQTHRSYRQP